MLKNYSILILILFLAFFLRLYQITNVPVSLFGDELDVGYHALSILKTGRDYQGNFLPLHFHSLAEWRTPLYIYAAVPTVALFGISPLGVRLPAVLFGVLSILGIYLVVKEILAYNASPHKFHARALLASFFLTINPWHLQYSRAGFEVAMLLAFLLFGLYFFFRSLRENGKYLWLSALFLIFTPWIYSTAKLFAPLLIVFLLIAWRKEIIQFPIKEKLVGTIVALIIGLPIAVSTITGGGAERAAFTSVFTDETISVEVGSQRMRDLLVRGESVLLGKARLSDKLFHNKAVVWANNITDNFIESFSFNFLFISGDPNLRHTPEDSGLFYKTDALILVAGIVFFFSSKLNKKIKYLVLFLLLGGALPSALTRDGGTHATRLILILPPIIFLISYGLVQVCKSLNILMAKIFLTCYFLLLTSSLFFYLHNYYNHYPWNSERWWHAGINETILKIKEEESGYEKVILSMAGEPMWIFFAGWYEFPPERWQKEYPLDNKVELEGFGEVSYIDKFYFGNFNVPGKGIYDLGNYLDKKTLYMATAKEVNVDLISEPERTPANLKLIKGIIFPSGEPAYYLFSGK